MSSEKSPTAVSTEEHELPTQNKKEKNCDNNNPFQKCTCIENLTCDSCIARNDAKKEYKTMLSKSHMFDTGKSTLYSNGVSEHQDILSDLEKIQTFYKDTCEALTESNVPDKNTPFDNENSQTLENDETEKCDTDYDCHEKLNANEVANQHFNFDSNSSNSSEKTIDGEIGYDNLDQSIKSCDIIPNLITETDCTADPQHTEQTDLNPCKPSTSQIHRRIRRNSKRKRNGEDSCPVCGLTIRHSELDSHFTKEVDNLSKIHINIRKIPLGEGNGVNDSYVQVKCNRENRRSAKVAKYAENLVHVHCPVCTEKLTGTENERNVHVLNCSEQNYFSDDVNVTDLEDSIEEYEFGDETRVRAIDFIPGGYRALQGGKGSSKSKTAEDEEVDIEDDTEKYGTPQYTELDVIHNQTDESDDAETEQLRKAVLIDPTAKPQIIESKKWSNTDEKNLAEEPKKESGRGGQFWRTNLAYKRAGYLGTSEHTDESSRDNEDQCVRKRKIDEDDNSSSLIEEGSEADNIGKCIQKKRREEKNQHAECQQNEEAGDIVETKSGSIEDADESNVIEKGESKEDTKKDENKDSPGNSTQAIVLSLRERIKNLEEQNKSGVKCLICLESYTKPVVSTRCWHVYCEECWLTTMGVKKLCPQCSLIVVPSDLRRIYL